MEQCCVLQNDVIHHTLSHITARHLITRSRAAKFQTSTSRSSFECLTLSQSQILMNSGTLTSTSSQEQHNYFLYICTQTQNDKKLRFALHAAQFGHGYRMVCTLSFKMLQTWPPLKPTHLLQISAFTPREGLNKCGLQGLPIKAFHQGVQLCTHMGDGTEYWRGTHPLQAAKSAFHSAKAPIRRVLGAGGRVKQGT